MARVCSWCDLILGGCGASEISHTLCESCLDDLRESLESSPSQIALPGLAELRPN
jgi:hypothetical protein